MTLVSWVPEYIVVLVTFNFRYLASAPEVRWRARAGALARTGAEAPASACSHNRVFAGFHYRLKIQ
jgi:hypothetical protein